MKTILYICTEAASGMIPYASVLIQAATKSAHLEAYAITVDDRKRSYRPGLEHLPAEHIRFLRMPNNLLKRILYKLYAGHILKEVKKISKSRHIDVIHLLTVEYTCATIVRQLQKIGCLYYTVHDVVPHERVYTGIKEYFFSIYMRLAVKYIMRKADCLVTNSHNQCQLIKNMYPNKKTYYQPFPPLITDSILTGNKSCPEIASLYGYILFFGCIDKYKGIEYLYEAFVNNEKLRDYKLVIAGKGPVYFPYTDDPRIVFINRYIEEEEVKSLFTRASCVVYPYISATQSGVLTIACQFQTPALVSDIPFFREITDEKCCLFFKPADTRDLSEKLERLLFHTDINEMKSAQQTFFENNYAENAVLASIENIYCHD